MRKWIVRGLVFFCLGGMTLIGLAYQYWTNPEAIRRQVLTKVHGDLVNVSATVEAARLRLFGGIEVRELRLSRKDDLDRSDFLHIPSATLMHDKEHVLEGVLSLRKMEIRRPRLRLIRDHDGHWNVCGLLGPADLNKRLPATLIRQGTLIIEDRLAAAGSPPLEIHDVSLSTVNDPLPIVSFEGSGVCEPAGLVRIHGRATRGGGPMTLTIEAPDLHLGPDLVERLAGYAPEAAIHLRRLNARIKLHAELTLNAGSQSAPTYSIQGQVMSGEFAHALLPWPLEQLSGSFSVRDGLVPEARLRQAAGRTQVEVALRELKLTSGLTLMDRAAGVEVDVRHATVNGDLFSYLPPNLQNFKQEYSPEGIASLHLDLQHLGPGKWLQNGTLDIEEARGSFHAFRYPVEKVKGQIQWRNTTDSAHPEFCGSPNDWLSLDLSGQASGRTVCLKGRLEGERGQSGLTLDLWGNDLPLDGPMLDALPARSKHQADNFAPSGRFDFRVFLRRPRGEKEVSKRFLLHLHHCKACYKVFPLPLTDVSGTLDIRPDSWEFRDFVGHYKGGTLRASGRSRSMDAAPTGSVARLTPSPVRQASYRQETDPKPTASRVSLAIDGSNLPIDDGFKAALAPGREALAKAVDTFNLTGKLNFSAHIDDLPNQPRDIDVTVRVGGCRIKPTFFGYPLEDVAATVRYAKSNVWLTGFQGRHGKTVVYVKQGSVVLPEQGGFWARLDRLQASPLALDGDLQQALPGSLGKLTRVLKLSEPVNLAAELVVSQAATPGARTSVFWDAILALKDTEIEAGAKWFKVTGLVSCKGLHNGQQVEDVVGNVFLEKATLFDQPLRNVHLPLVVWKEQPDILRLPDIKADLYGGMVDGQARLELGSIFRYEMVLNASRIQLEQLAGQNFRSAQMSGLANASLHLHGDAESMNGNGRLDVPAGKMYRLPLLLDLLKWLGLRLPDRTAFEQAHAKFRIEGPRLHIDDLELVGSAISVRGQGGMKLDGSDVKLDLNADWGRLWPLLPPGINTLSREIWHQLLKVKVRGKVSQLKFEQEIVPVVTEPLKKLWKGLSSSPAPPDEKGAGSTRD